MGLWALKNNCLSHFRLTNDKMSFCLLTSITSITSISDNPTKIPIYAAYLSIGYSAENSTSSTRSLSAPAVLRYSEENDKENVVIIGSVNNDSDIDNSDGKIGKNEKERTKQIKIRDESLLSFEDKKEDSLHPDILTHISSISIDTEKTKTEDNKKHKIENSKINNVDMISKKTNLSSDILNFSSKSNRMDKKCVQLIPFPREDYSYFRVENMPPPMLLGQVMVIT